MVAVDQPLFTPSRTATGAATLSLAPLVVERKTQVRLWLPP